jgi:electron transfer flavoprotein beta subunit
MHIAVCVCQVPDTASVIGFVDGAIDLSRVHEVINPFDEYALEEAVRIKERFEGSVVTVFTVAPASAKEMLRKTLALGADRALLVSGATASDPFQTALLLSRAISACYGEVLPELVFCGKHSTDFQSGQVPLMLAELLGIASVSAVIALNASPERLHVEREIEGGIEYLDVHYPALFSMEKGANVPRKTSIKAVMEARKKPLDLLPMTINERPLVTMRELKPLVRKKICRFVPDARELIRLLSREHALF